MRTHHSKIYFESVRGFEPMIPPRPRPRLSTSASLDESKSATVAKYATDITAAMAKSREGIFQAGRLLLQAKEELGHGNFLTLVDNKLPFSARTAEMLMRIAANPVITNPKFASNLPWSWATLHEMTRIPEADLARLLEQGAITENSRRRDVHALFDRISAEGEELTAALGELARFMSIRPEAEFNHEVFDLLLETFDPDHFQQAATWLMKLRRRAVEHQNT